jgi:hypothetical protein
LKNAVDRRHNIANHRHSFTTSRIISTSFDPKNQVCNARQKWRAHGSQPGAGGSIDTGNKISSCFVLSDQNFPAMLPVEKDGECPKIFQIEHGILAGLIKIFLGVTLGFAVPAGTVVIIFFAN